MPYLIYKIEGDNYTYLETFDDYRAARDRVREIRAQQAAAPTAGSQSEAQAETQGADEAAAPTTAVRLIFAADQDEAVTLLSEKREAPILKEWEK